MDFTFPNSSVIYLCFFFENCYNIYLADIKCSKNNVNAVILFKFINILNLKGEIARLVLGS